MLPSEATEHHPSDAALENDHTLQRHQPDQYHRVGSGGSESPPQTPRPVSRKRPREYESPLHLDRDYGAAADQPQGHHSEYGGLLLEAASQSPTTEYVGQLYSQPDASTHGMPMPMPPGMQHLAGHSVYDLPRNDGGEHVGQGHQHLHPDYDQNYVQHHQIVGHTAGGMMSPGHHGALVGPQSHSHQMHQFIASGGTPHPLTHSVDMSLSGHDRLGGGLGSHSAAYHHHSLTSGALDHQFGQREIPNGLSDMRAIEPPYDDDFEMDGYTSANGEWVQRPSVEEKTLAELCEISHLHNNEKFQSLFVDYTEGVTFPLGEGGRELLRACLNAKGCKGRQLQGASVPQLLTLAHNWGMWNIALRIKIERATGGFCKHHKDFVQFKASQSQLRKYLKREQMATDRDADGKITSIQFEEMKYLTLGKEGREKLRAQLRRMHDKDAQHMDRLLESHSFKYSELRNATVPSLLKMANICGMWPEVVQACRDQEAKREQRHSIKHPRNEYSAPKSDYGVVKSEYGGRKHSDYGSMQLRHPPISPQLGQSQALPPASSLSLGDGEPSVGFIGQSVAASSHPPGLSDVPGSPLFDHPVPNVMSGALVSPNDHNPDSVGDIGAWASYSNAISYW